MNAFPLTLFGYGNMGKSLAAALSSAYEWPLSIVEKDATQRQQAEKDFTNNPRIKVLAPKAVHAHTVAKSLIILAIKPQDADAILNTFTQWSASLMILSIMAGIPIMLLKKTLPHAQIARIMPSLAAKLGKAASGLSFDAAAKNDFRAQVRCIGNCMGLCVELPESLIPAITGISGSAIAFVFRFIEALTLAGTREGIAYKDALAITLEVVEAGALLCKHEAIHPAALAARVSSPGGTTVEGLAALEEGAFSALIAKAVRATVEKSRSMEEKLLETHSSGQKKDHA